MSEKKLKLIIYIVVTVVVTSTALIAYRNIVLIPKLKEINRLESQRNFIEEKKHYFLEIRLALLQINNLNIKESEYYDDLSENLDRVEASINSLESLSLSDSEINFLSEIDELNDLMLVEKAIYDRALMFNPRNDLVIPNDANTHDEFLYAVTSSFVLYEELIGDKYPDIVSTQEQNLSELSSSIPISYRAEDYKNERFLIAYREYVDGFYPLKQATHDLFTSTIKQDSTINILKNLTNLIWEYDQLLSQLYLEIENADVN